MTARTAFWTLAATCAALTIIRGRIDGLTVLATIFTVLAIAARTQQKADRS